MSLKINKNIVLKGKHDKPILADVFYKKTTKEKPLVIYCHGYKGFKDWGANNLVAEYLANNGVFFLKFNFSYNGGTIDQPIDFPDLEAFANNNFSKELDDLETVLDWITSEEGFSAEINSNDITLMGHSRGSGIAIIKAEEDSRVKKVISLAGISNYSSRFPSGKELDLWKKHGVAYITNARTNQEMPLYFQLYEDFTKNKNRLNIQRAVKNLNKPHLIIHGTQDPTVPLEEAKEVHKWSTMSSLEIIDEADHVFNASQPWKHKTLPKNLEKAIALSRDFILNRKLFDW